MRRRQMMQMASGAPRMVEGTFTLASDAVPPEIVHNLGTQKIACVIYPTSTVVPHGGYRAYFLCCVNVFPFIQGQTWTLDFTQYNSGHFPDPVVVDVGTASSYPRIANGQSSPWTTQSNFRNGEVYPVYPEYWTFTDNSFKLVGAQFASGSYKYMIWALE